MQRRALTILSLWLLTVVLQAGCLAKRMTLNPPPPNETSSERDGLRATITRIRWQDENHLRVTYCLDQVSECAPWEIGVLDPVSILLWDRDGQEVGTRQFPMLGITEDFLARSTHFEADLVVAITEDARYLTIGLGHLVTKRVMIPAKDLAKSHLGR